MTQNKAKFIPDENNCPKIRQLLIGLGALSCEIFNYIHNSISYEFKHHFEVFNISMIAVLQSFELFDSCLTQKMPVDLKNYVENIKKRFMVSDIWENEVGFKLLFSSQTNPSLIEMRTKIWVFTKKRVQ